MVGELDHDVDPASTLQVVNVLITVDKDFELIVFAGADHGAEAANMTSAAGATFSCVTFLASNQGGVPMT